MKKEIKIPEIAENVTSGIVAGILVSKGDKVSIIPSDKRYRLHMRVTSGYYGTVERVMSDRVLVRLDNDYTVARWYNSSSLELRSGIDNG